MKRAEELKIKFSEQNKSIFQSKQNTEDSDDEILSTPEILNDNILSQYFNSLRNLFETFNKSKAIITVSKLRTIKNPYFKELDTRAFERNINDNDKNIFFYLTYVKFDNDLIDFFAELCQETDQLNLSSNPLWHELGRYGSHKLTPLEHALARDNVCYALLIADQMLTTFDIKTLKFLVNRTSRKDLAAESRNYTENCKKLNYLIICRLLFNFNKYSIKDKDLIVDCITTLINDDYISTDDSYNYIQQIETSKKYSSSDNKSYILPLLHRIATLANIDPTRSEKLLKSISREKLAELNKEVIKENGDTVLLAFCFYIKNKPAIEILKILLTLLDPKVTSVPKQSNIFHKLLRNYNLSILPEILDMLVPLLKPELLKELWSSPDKDGYLPFEELIPGRSKTPKRTTSRDEASLQEMQNNLTEPDYTQAIPTIRRIVSLWPESCKYSLGANKENLLMHAIKNKSLRKIISEIILQSEREHQNKQGQNALQMAASLDINLDEYIQKARVQKDHPYYKTGEDYEKVCKERDNNQKIAEDYRTENKQLRGDLEKSQKNLAESRKSYNELKRNHEELNNQHEVSESDLKRVRNERDGLIKEKKQLNQELQSTTSQII